MLKTLHNAFLAAPAWFQIVFVAVWIYAIIWAINWICGFIKYYNTYTSKLVKERIARIFAVRDEIDAYIAKNGIECFQEADGSRYFIVKGHKLTEKYIFSQMAKDDNFEQMIGFFEKLHKENPVIKVKEVDEEETK